ncbi:MAG: OsmC family protein [Nitrospinota bacterium]
MAIRPKELPETIENWAEADWQGHQKSIVKTKSGHTLIVDEPRSIGGTDEGTSPMGYLFTAMAGCTAVIVERVAKGLGIEIQAMKVKASGIYSPRGIAGQEGYESAPSQFNYEVTLKTAASDAQIEELKDGYFKRCPVYNLCRKSGAEIIENWTIER